MHKISISPAPFLTLWFLAGFVTPSLAQTNKLFQWQFADSALASVLPTCSALQIVVKSFDPTTNATHGTPPYYMIAFAVGATPVTTLIGTDENDLSWTVTQPVGSKLILSVVDANGSAGGIPPQILSVIAGQTTQCVTTPSTTAFTVTANVTGDLTTCQPWGLTVKGGVPPYVVTLAQPNSPIVTNVTIPNGLDTFTFIDRADPNGQLIGAISDFTGQWATGTPIVNTKGSSDVSCVGLVSSSGDSTIIKQQEDAANAAAQTAKRRHATIIGVSVTLVLLFLIGIGGLSFFYLRKRKREAQAELAQAQPHQYVETGSTMLSINNSDSAPSQPVSRKGAILAEIQNSDSNSRDSTSSPFQSSSTAALSSDQGGLNKSPSVTLTNPNFGQIRSQSRNSGVSNPAFANFPSSSIRRSAKGLEASTVVARSSDSEYPETDAQAVTGDVSGLSIGRGIASSVTDEVVFQHRDAGVVRELPPPYADRARRSRPSSS